MTYRLAAAITVYVLFMGYMMCQIIDHGNWRAETVIASRINLWFQLLLMVIWPVTYATYLIIYLRRKKK